MKHFTAQETYDAQDLSEKEKVVALPLRKQGWFRTESGQTCFVFRNWAWCSCQDFIFNKSRRFCKHIGRGFKTFCTGCTRETDIRGTCERCDRKTAIYIKSHKQKTRTRIAGIPI